MNFEIVDIEKTESLSTIIGQSHFIKTVEDLYEAMISSCTGIKFGIAFCESSGPCMVRADGNDDELKKLAIENALKLGSGHSFIILFKDAYPINVLPAIKDVHEVCSIYCATSNPVKVLVVEEGDQRGICGILDGYKTLGVESEKDVEDRITLLRDIGYKRGLMNRVERKREE